MCVYLDEKDGSGCRYEDLELISTAADSAHCGGTFLNKTWFLTVSLHTAAWGYKRTWHTSSFKLCVL